MSQAYPVTRYVMVFDDCDGEVDEDLGTASVGVGECEATVDNCVDPAAAACEPGLPSDEVCDGLDNDWDGEVDEDLGTAGAGECEATVDNCVDAAAAACEPGLPSGEVPAFSTSSFKDML
jgi:hypothetical protein